MIDPDRSIYVLFHTYTCMHDFLYGTGGVPPTGSLEFH